MEHFNSILLKSGIANKQHTYKSISQFLKLRGHKGEVFTAIVVSPFLFYSSFCPTSPHLEGLFILLLLGLL